MLYRRLLGLPALVVMAGLALTLGACNSSAADVPCRALRAALYHMKEAREEIKDERLQRHRERIEANLRIAIREVETALGAAKIDVRYEPTKGWDEKHKTFRHLRQALVELDLAKGEVEREKGDWARRRELRQAIEDAHRHVKDALEEIK
jgi:hypothetical protein